MDAPAGQWVTTHATVWRTAPTAMGFRIERLNAGWTVYELASAEPTPGWLQIQPRGYVLLCDLAPVPAAGFLAAPYGDWQGRGAAYTNEGTDGEDNSEQGMRAALLALREENVRLREGNIELKQKEVHKAQTEVSVAQLEAQLRDLEHSKEEAESQMARMKGKLRRCQEAVLSAVDKVDALFEARDAAMQDGFDDSADGAMDAVEKARIEAVETGEEVTALLGDGEDEEDDDAVTEPDDVDVVQPATNTVKPFVGQENIMSSKGKERLSAAPLENRQRLSALNAVR